MTQHKTPNTILVLAILACVVYVCGVSELYAQKITRPAVEINRAQMTDFWRDLKSKIATKTIDLDSSFTVEIAGSIDRNGKLDSQGIREIRSEGDPKLTTAARDAILAFADSGWFGYFRGVGMTEVTVLLQQDTSDFSASLKSPAGVDASS